MKLPQTEYRYAKLHTVANSPFIQFNEWYVEAQKHEPHFNVMALATALDNKPSCRIVLLKEFSAQGFLFLSHYSSRKGQEIEKNNNVSLLFYWDKLERQVRIEGTIHKTSEQESNELFSDRPRASQIASIISKQSQALVSRAQLEQDYNEACNKFANTHHPIPRPATIGGYRVIPENFEFWQGGEHRLNYRFLYTQENKQWTNQLLYP